MTKRKPAKKAPKKASPLDTLTKKHAAAIRRERRKTAALTKENAQLRKDLGDAQFDLVQAKHKAEMAEPTWHAVSTAREQLAAADARMTAENANLRQRIYTQKLMMERFLEYLPPSARESALATINAPMPELEKLQ